MTPLGSLFGMEEQGLEPAQGRCGEPADLIEVMHAGEPLCVFTCGYPSREGAV
jgi:hypothetical protein